MSVPARDLGGCRDDHKKPAQRVPYGLLHDTASIKGVRHSIDDHGGIGDHGSSGCRILVTLMYEMKKRGLKYGLATLCIAGGMGQATVIEMCD